MRYLWRILFEIPNIGRFERQKGKNLCSHIGLCQAHHFAAQCPVREAAYSRHQV